jgi:hypothetical protein
MRFLRVAYNERSHRGVSFVENLQNMFVVSCLVRLYDSVLRFPLL